MLLLRGHKQVLHWHEKRVEPGLHWMVLRCRCRHGRVGGHLPLWHHALQAGNVHAWKRSRGSRDQVVGLCTPPPPPPPAVFFFFFFFFLGGGGVKKEGASTQTQKAREEKNQTNKKARAPTQHACQSNTRTHTRTHTHTHTHTCTTHPNIRDVERVAGQHLRHGRGEALLLE